MSYSVDNYSRSKTIAIEDGTIDNSLDVRLIGKSYAGYGELQNENFVFLLENFAGINPPARPVNGQLWYDTNVRKIRIYDAAVQQWRTVGTADVSADRPTGSSLGDFWWDAVNKQLYVYNGAGYTLVGPQGTPGLGTTEMQTTTLNDVVNNINTVILGIVNGVTVFIISAVEFIPNEDSQEIIGGPVAFPVIKKGITLSNVNSSGIVSSGFSDTFWGTASSALGLVSGNTLKPLYSANDFILKDNLNFISEVKFSDSGFKLGDSEDLEVRIDTDGLTPIFNAKTSSRIEFKTSNGTNRPLIISGNNLIPGTENSSNIGSSTVPYKNVYAQTFIGSFVGNGSGITNINPENIVSGGGSIPPSALSGTYNIDISGNASTSTISSKSDLLFVADAVVANRYRPALINTASNGTPNSVAVRDSVGNLNAVLFQGTATSALFADLAEKYLPDADYEIGTVVVIGGEAEITKCNLGDRAFGAISGSPAFMMNSELVGGVYVALKGRVPVKVNGPVKKGDRLIADINGCAGVASVILKNMPIKAGGFPDTFAIALETNLASGVKLVEAVIL